MPPLFSYVLAVVAVSLGLVGPTLAEAPCGVTSPCTIGDRSYYALPPERWDNESPLPILLHFHGWGRTGAQVLRNERVAGATRANGVLLVAPNGLGKSWDFWNSSSRDSDFVDRIIEDLPTHWPIERDRIYISGFSWGGSMAWRLACERGDRFAAYLSISGALYRQGSETCAAGPARVTHVHGLADTVMDIPRTAEDGPLAAVELWRRNNGCNTPPDRSWTDSDYACYEWTDCASGLPVRLCLHPKGHFIPDGWLKARLSELLAEPAQ